MNTKNFKVKKIYKKDNYIYLELSGTEFLSSEDKMNIVNSNHIIISNINKEENNVKR